MEIKRDIHLKRLIASMYKLSGGCRCSANPYDFLKSEKL